MMGRTPLAQLNRSVEISEENYVMNEPRADHIMQVGLGFWASKTLLSAVEMELFTELAKHPETLAELSARLRLHPRSARDKGLAWLRRAVAKVFRENKSRLKSPR